MKAGESTRREGSDSSDEDEDEEDVGSWDMTKHTSARFGIVSQTFKLMDVRMFSMS